ncbi:MAG: hypothetical protein AAGC71_00555 [Pseudomonadota bacterium]
MTDRAAKEQAAAEQVASIGMPAPGDEPQFLPHPLLDALLESVVALGGELWIERDRRMALEALLAEKGILDGAEIEAWKPDAAQAERRAEELKALTDRVLKALRAVNGTDATLS